MADAQTDVATAIAIGCRQRQEDAVIADFAAGAPTGFAVLSDGMGGHDDGDLASRIIVSEVFSAFSLASRADASAPHAGHAPETDSLRERLRDAVIAANQRLRDQVDAGTGQEGMGGTVITAVIQDTQLRWISIGDSGLYLFRSKKIRRLNEIHSLAPQIDMMVTQGAIDAEAGRTHPQRDCLTSALVGSAINRIDCPEEPVRLMPGDIVLLASDGLAVLDDAAIARILGRYRHRSSQRIARALMEAVARQDAPEQDNVAIAVIKPALPNRERRVAGDDRVDGLLRGLSVRGPALRGGLRIGLDRVNQHVIAPLTGRSAP